jgi:hypothetical protein
MVCVLTEMGQLTHCGSVVDGLGDTFTALCAMINSNLAANHQYLTPKSNF